MAVSNHEVLEIIEVMEAFLERKRPPDHLRPKIDIGYKFEDPDLFIFEIRPSWNDSSKTIFPKVAKATFIKSKSHWKVFWLRGNLKWFPYDPKATVKRLADFVKLVEEDEYGCFWG